jgi:hypothetical protein
MPELQFALARILILQVSMFSEFGNAFCSEFDRTSRLKRIGSASLAGQGNRSGSIERIFS